MKSKVQKDTTQTEKEIFNLLNTDAQLRSKRELIEKFLQENLPQLENTDDINEEFEKFWSKEQVVSFEKLIREENLSAERTEILIADYIFGEREPMRDEVLALIEGEPPTLLERKKIGDRILSKLMAFVETFINNMGDK